MKFMRWAVTTVLAVTMMMLVSAQELTETTTLMGVTVSHPSGYLLHEIQEGAIVVADPTDTFGVLIFTGSGLSAVGVPDGLSIDDLLEVFSTIAEVSGEPEDITLENGSGVMMPAMMPNFGAGNVVFLNTPDGLLFAFTAGNGIDVSEDFQALALDIIGSVSFEASALPPASTEAVPTETSPTEDDTTPTAPTGEITCPIPVDEMPEGTLLFCDGVQMTLPENWTLGNTLTELDNFASISRENFAVSVSTLVNEISPFYNPEMYIRDIVKISADIEGHTTFDPAEHVITALDEDGIKIQYYDAEEFIEITDENAVRQVVFIITLNNDLFVTHTFTWIESIIAEEDFEAEAVEIVQSTALADFYDGAPAMVDVDGEMLFVGEASWSDSTYLFRFNEEMIFVVSCPAGGLGDDAPIWGTDVYTSDSSVCLAAAHTGAITLADGGMVLVTMLPGQESYTGSTANGVTTLEYGEWSESFSVAPFEVP